MATTVGALNYRIGFDTTQLPEGVNLTRREMGNLRKLMQATKDPVEQLGEEIDVLNQLYDKGAISIEQHQRALDKLSKAIDDQTMVTAELVEEQDESVTTLQDVHSAVAVAKTAYETLSGALSTVVSIGRQAIDIIKEINEQQQLETALGLSPAELKGIELAIGAIGGNSDQVADSLREMKKRIVDATEGGGEASEEAAAKVKSLQEQSLSTGER